MARDCPFIIAVASEKGGVGKTTIATNLAVYLKALREDLPVTIASFDNHFSVDNMFAIGRHRGASVAGLFDGAPAAGLVQLGEYGVQFLASERQLSPPDDDPARLARVLAGSDLSGILVIDTRPILDYFTRSALNAADLVLVPIKDRPSLVNAAALKAVLLEGGGEPERLWLVPSLIDARLRLRRDLGMGEFLRFSALERGYQVVDTAIAKSPKVEGLTTGFSSRIRPVLSHARSTAVHRQLRDLASFVLARYDGAGDRRCAAASGVLADNEAVPPQGRLRRMHRECPVCHRQAVWDDAFLLQDLRSRRRGYIHGECLEALLSELPSGERDEKDGMLALVFSGPGLAGPGSAMRWILYDEEGVERAEERVESDRCLELWETVSGRAVEEAYREVLVIHLARGLDGSPLSGKRYERFSRLRRKVMREALLTAG